MKLYGARGWRRAGRPWRAYFPGWWIREVTALVEKMSSMIRPKWELVCESWDETVRRTRESDVLCLDGYWGGMIPLRRRTREKRSRLAVELNQCGKELWNLIRQSQAAYFVSRRHFDRYSPDLATARQFGDFVAESLAGRRHLANPPRGWLSGAPPKEDAS